MDIQTSGFKIIGGEVDSDSPSNEKEYLRNYRWAVQQLGPVKMGYGDVVLKELQLPDLQIQKQMILGGQINYKFAKSVEWNDLQIVFYDDGELLKQINSWIGLVFDIKNGTGIKSHKPDAGYKQTCSFVLLDGCATIVNTIILKNAWPSSIILGRLDYANTEVKQITLTLSFDWAILPQQNDDAYDYGTNSNSIPITQSTVPSDE